jgi:hypothetical protein
MNDYEQLQTKTITNNYERLKAIINHLFSNMKR